MEVNDEQVLGSIRHLDRYRIGISNSMASQPVETKTVNEILEDFKNEERS